MCALKSRGMSVVCTWWLRGAFSRHEFFLWFPPAHLVCHSPLCKYVPNLPYVYQNSNTPCFLGISTCACVLVVTSSPHHHRPSVIITAHPTSFQPYPPATIWLHTMHPKNWLHTSIAPQTSIATIEIICPSWLKSPPPQSQQCTLLWRTVTWICPLWFLAAAAAAAVLWQSPSVQQLSPV
jgi:hypothetical protein